MFANLEKTLPRRSYLEPREFTREYRAIFQTGWVCVGRSETLAQTGDYLALKLGEAAILVVRNEQGELNALHNVCRHRGAELVPLPDHTPVAGRFSRGITCPYHAWSYRLNGVLRGAPHIGIEPGSTRLHGVDVEEWGGFIFVQLNNRRQEGLIDSLGSGVARIARYPLESLQVTHTIDYRIAANWKVILENYNECYHCGPVHPELCQIVPAFRQGGGDGLDWDAGIPHRPGANTFTATGTTNRRPFPGLSEAEQNNHKGELFYPNLMLSLAMDHVAAFYVWPESAGETRVRCDFLFHPDEIGREDFDGSDAIDFWDLVNQQDWRICESVQRGMNNPVFEYGYYAPMEDYSLDLRRYVSERLSSDPATHS